MSEPVKLYIELTAAEAWQLADFMTKARLSQYPKNAYEEEEAYTRICAMEKVQAALYDAGYKPR